MRRGPVETQALLDADTMPAWFCLRSQPKHEHIAAANLRKQGIPDVLNPRIRFKRSTRRGPVWVTEALFPGYLFAKFHWKDSLRLVHHTHGVTGVVRFGSRWPTLPDQHIEELRTLFGGDGIRVMEESVKPGNEIRISGGVFHGFSGVIMKVMPARERVAVLLEFLGNQTTIEVPMAAIVRRGGAD